MKIIALSEHLWSGLDQNTIPFFFFYAIIGSFLGLPNTRNDRTKLKSQFISFLPVSLNHFLQFLSKSTTLKRKEAVMKNFKV